MNKNQRVETSGTDLPFKWAGSLTDVSALSASRVVEMAISFATTVLAAAMLGPAQFGKAVLIMSLPRLLWSVSSVKAMTITTRYIAGARAKGDESEIRSLCKLSYLVDGLTSLVFLSLVGLCVWLPLATISVGLTLCYSASYAFTCFVGTSRAVLLSWERFRWIAGLRIFEKAIRFSITFLLLEWGAGPAGLVLATAVGHIVLALGIFTAAHHLLSSGAQTRWWKTSTRRALQRGRELIPAFSWNYLASTLNGMSSNLPLLLLGHGADPESAGYYSLAVSFVSVVAIPESSYKRVVYPKLSARWALGGQSELEKAIRRWCTKAAIGLACLYALMIVAAPPLIRFAFGPRFDPVMPITQILLLGALGSGLFFWITPYYYAGGEIALWTKLQTVRVVFALGLGWILSLRLGASGMAISIALFTVLFTFALMALRRTRSACSPTGGADRPSAVPPAQKAPLAGPS